MCKSFEGAHVQKDHFSCKQFRWLDLLLHYEIQGFLQGHNSKMEN